MDARMDGRSIAEASWDVTWGQIKCHVARCPPQTCWLDKDKDGDKVGRSR